MRTTKPVLGFFFSTLALLSVLSPACAQDSVESTDILSRQPVTELARVQHVLIGWQELAPNYRGQMDPRAAQRTRQQADDLARSILKRAQAGEDFKALMKEFSEDPGSAQTGRLYDVTPQARLVPEFKNLGLRLKVGEVGVVETTYGWHIIKRVE